MDNNSLKRLHLVLSQDDQEHLQRVLQHLTAISGKNSSLNQLISQWLYFVREVERGYNDSIYEYTNDLSTRDLLAEIEAILTIAGQEQLGTVLKGLDDQFRSATVPTTKPVRGEPEQQLPWWWYRIPSKIVGELEDDLRAEGIL